MNSTPTNTPSVVNQVFDGAANMIEGGKAIANMAFSTFENLNSLTQQQSQNGGMFSRRDMNYQQTQPMQYQPSVYPWSSQSYQNMYGQQQTAVGYSGITNQNYGKPGFYTGSPYNSGFPAFTQSGGNVSRWFEEGVWGY